MNNKENKKISVIMGIYNCQETLPAAIDSILAQTYEDWEFILCDDCSTDGTYNIAKHYQELYPDKIILIRNEQNMRLAYSLNHCLEYATGYYVARMDGDDLSVPDRFEKQVKYLNQHPGIQLVGTAMRQFNENDGDIQIVRRPEMIHSKYDLKKGYPFNHATIMTYKWVYDKIGGYTVCERTARCEDQDLWFKFFYNGFIGDNIQEPLYLVREDLAAIKRRTIKSRWAAYNTTVEGYKLLQFPRIWLVKEFAETVIKSIVPYKMQLLYRKLQKKRIGNNK